MRDGDDTDATSPTSLYAAVTPSTREEPGQALVDRVAEVIPFVVFLAHARDGVEHVSAYFQEYTGLPASSALGMGWRALVHPGDLEVATQLLTTQPRGRSIQLAARIADRDGRYRLHELRATALDPAGERWFGTCTEIVDRRRSIATREELVAGVAASLRAPLAMIVACCHALGVDGADPERRAHGLEVIERSARAQVRILDDLLDASKGPTARDDLSPRLVSMSELTREAIRLTRPSPLDKGVEVRLEVDGSCDARVDADRMRRVLWHLISNALRFTPVGGAIHIAVREEPGTITIRIRDSGPSGHPATLSPERRPLPGVAAEGDVGLEVCRMVVERHGGQLLVQSAGRGLGASVTMEIPTGLALRRSEEEASMSTARSSALVGLRILLVDDEDDERELAATILGRHGAAVETAGGASEAMLRLALRASDVVVSDLGMPEEDGCALARRVLSVHPRARVIALSGHARSTAEARALDAGFARYLTKPLDPEELVRAILDAVGGAAQSRV